MRMIFARTQNNVIGVDGELPWHCPEDLKLFKEYTTGEVVVMGRKTFQSLGCKPLPNRLNIVVTSKYDEDDFPQYDNLLFNESFVNVAYKYPTAIIIGGAQIYNLALEHGVVEEVSESRMRCFVCPEDEQEVTTFAHNFSDWDCVHSRKYLEFNHFIYRRK